MKLHLLTGLFTLGMVTASAAATGIDANGDGVLTLDEVQAAFPEITAEGFTAMDKNADGMLDADEVAAGQDAGMMPKS